MLVYLGFLGASHGASHGFLGASHGSASFSGFKHKNLNLDGSETRNFKQSFGVDVAGCFCFFFPDQWLVRRFEVIHPIDIPQLTYES